MTMFLTRAWTRLMVVRPFPQRLPPDAGCRVWGPVFLCSPPPLSKALGYLFRSAHSLPACSSWFLIMQLSGICLHALWGGEVFTSGA